MTTQQADPLDIIVPDTSLDRARRALATCERKLAGLPIDGTWEEYKP